MLLNRSQKRGTNTHASRGRPHNNPVHQQCPVIATPLQRTDKKTSYRCTEGAVDSGQIGKGPADEGA